MLELEIQEPEPSSEANPLIRHSPPKRTSLPIRQLLVLACIRLADSIRFTIVSPFINQMMRHLKVTDTPSDVGFYTGLMDSFASFVQLLFILYWGRLSDRIGRRPVILIGLTGCMFSITLFGLSNSLVWALLAQCLAGAFSGSFIVIKSILSEITDATNEAQVMPFFSIMWNIGCIIGPMLGGTMSTPAQQYPNSFISRVQLFQDYPYLLPCLVGTLILFAALILGYFCLEETKGSQDKNVPTFPPLLQSTSRVKALKDHEDGILVDCSEATPALGGSASMTHGGRSRATGGELADEFGDLIRARDKPSRFAGADGYEGLRARTSVAPPSPSFTDEEESPAEPAESRTDADPPTPPSALELLRHLPLQRVITSSFILSILDKAYEAVFSLLCYTPIHLGGLSRTAREIGYAFAMGGFFSITILPFCFPLLQRRYGTRKMYCTLMYLWPVVFLSLPILNVIARMSVQNLGEDGAERLTPTGDKILWLGIGSIVLLTRIISMTFTLNIMLIKFAAPDKKSLGSTYAVSETVVSIAETGSPAFFSSLFALSIGQQLLHGQAIWLVMTVIAFLGVYTSRALPDPDKPQDSSG